MHYAPTTRFRGNLLSMKVSLIHIGSFLFRDALPHFTNALIRVRDVLFCLRGAILGFRVALPASEELSLLLIHVRGAFYSSDTPVSALVTPSSEPETSSSRSEAPSASEAPSSASEVSFSASESPSLRQGQRHHQSASETPSSASYVSINIKSASTHIRDASACQRHPYPRKKRPFPI